MRILVTGGAGFVGSSLSIFLKEQWRKAEVIAVDNLRRRGSELALARLREHGVSFHHGDIRNPEDLSEVGSIDLLVECSAEASVHSGYGDNPAYVINTNLLGTVNCLELARRHGADIVFLSTSRVYPIDKLRSLPLERRGQRFALAPEASGPGWSAAGITTDFPLHGSRSLYGATKLCSELLIQEYSAMYDVRAIINRCGVLAGPWQMGKVDQGFVALWAARHFFGGKLAYLGFEGAGLQVRDVLHVSDLCELVRLQLSDIDRHRNRVYNVGGGAENSISLAELTALCAQRAGGDLEMGSDPETHPADIPFYVTDNAVVTEATGWKPRRTVPVILDDIFAWLASSGKEVQRVLSG